jgi:hypothetical protein
LGFKQAGEWTRSKNLTLFGIKKNRRLGTNDEAKKSVLFGDLASDCEWRDRDKDIDR